VPSGSSTRSVDLGLLLLRVGFGVPFIWFHGIPKLAGGMERWAGLGGALGGLGLPDGGWIMGLAAALAETVGVLFLILGLFTRPMGVVLAFVMVVAAAQSWVSGSGTPAHAFKNIWVFLSLTVAGPGRYSLDAWLARRRRR